MSGGATIRRIGIVTPVLDDWESFTSLVAEIAGQFATFDLAFEIIAVDDGSSSTFNAATLDLPDGGRIDTVSVIRVAINIGHQRAIAVGLSEMAKRDNIDAVVVMDSDGEDRPADIAALVAAAHRHPGHIILAHRAKRSEAPSFKAGYFAYKLLFRGLTGRSISFGNFCLIPLSAVRSLVHMPELWNNLAAAVMRSRLRYEMVPTARGTRYAGRSKMNLASLVLHGLSAMSVYADLIFVRVLLASAMVAVVSMVGIAVVVVIRLTTTLAMPNWATTVVGDLLIILLQTLVIVIATTLMVLASRSNRPMIPIVDAAAFVLRGRNRPASGAPERDRADVAVAPHAEAAYRAGSAERLSQRGEAAPYVET